MLKTRVITAAVLLGIFFAAIFLFPSDYWAIFCAAIAGLAAWEWAGLMRQAMIARWLYGAMTVVFALVFIFALSEKESSRIALALMTLSAFFWILLAPVWLTKRWQLPRSPLAWAIGWLILIPATGTLVLLRNIGPWFLLGVMALIWVADIAAYFCGKSFGKNKLAPSISPGKTREGALGAVFGVLIYGGSVAALTGWFAGKGMITWVGYGLLLIALTVLSIEGDLFESLLKRQIGVKDSSGLLPGHGGILDRIDSLTSTLPIVGAMVLVHEVIG